MLWGLTVASIVSVALVTALCSRLKWDKFSIVAPLQFLASLVTTLTLAVILAGDLFDTTLFWICFSLSAFLVVVFSVIRLINGPIDNPK